MRASKKKYTLSTPKNQPKSFIKVKNLHRFNIELSKLIQSTKLGQIAATLLNVKAVRLYQSTIFFKESNDVESSWHQDQAAVPLMTDKFLTIWIALDDILPSMGPLLFAKGSHKELAQISIRNTQLKYRVEKSSQYLKDIDFIKKDYQIQEPFSFLKGDATIHLGWTFHRAPSNPTTKIRRALAISYFEDGAKIYPDLIHFGRSTNEIRGIELTTANGTSIVVQLLRDDVGTWLPWLLKGNMNPGQAYQDNELTPIVWK